MLSDSDYKWLRTTANDLNNLLHVITESSNALGPVCGERPEGKRYFEFLQTSIQRAKEVTAQLAGRLGAAPAANEETGMPAAGGQRQQGAGYSIENPDGDKELILIIDDEELLVDLVKQMLAHAGYRVVASVNCFDALKIFKDLKQEISLVILDYTMPIMDGWDVFTALREIRPDVAVMLSSGFAEQDKVRMMLSQGLRGFLPKPYTEEKLLAQVRLTLDAVGGKTSS